MNIFSINSTLLSLHSILFVKATTIRTVILNKVRGCKTSFSFHIVPVNKIRYYIGMEPTFLLYRYYEQQMHLDQHRGSKYEISSS